MSLDILIPGVTTLFAAVFAAALYDQWLERRRAYQLVWALGMTFFAIASGSETVAAASGWNELLSRVWYLTGAVWTAGWLGLGTAFLLGKTRFGYGFALCLFLAGLFTFLAARKPEYAGAGAIPLIYFLVAGVLALAIAIETYFQNERWPTLAGVAVGGATVFSLILMATTTLAAPGYQLDPRTLMPVGTPFPADLRLLTPFMNITGGLALILGALFSAYVFMPKKRVLGYSLDPEQPGDNFLFNMIIGIVAIPVNFVASLPGAIRALVTGKIHSRVPATLLIALGAFVITGGDTLARLGDTTFFQLGKLVGVVLLFGGFIISIEVFREIRVPFTHVVLRAARQETAEAGQQH